MIKESCTLGQAMNVLQHAFDASDDKLKGHGERVAYLMWKVLDQQGKYSEEELIQIILVTFFHDIGAYKTEKNTNIMEFENHVTQQHAIYGYLFLKYLSPFDKFAEIVLYHHVAPYQLRQIESPYKKEAQLLNFLDKIELLLRAGGKLHEKNLMKIGQYILETEELESFMTYEHQEGFCAKLQEGTYQEELYHYLNTISLSAHQRIDLVRMLIFVIDARSPDTVAHSVYVSVTSMIVYEYMRQNTTVKNRIGLAGFLHDLGKMTTPLHILEKQGQLTDSEMELMKQHVVQSNKMLQDLGLYKIAAIAALHHEKLDGSGYPYGLSGENIPLEAKILMVVDILSALISKRSYKKAFAKEDVIGILTDLAGSNKLDDKIVRVIVRHYDEILIEAEKQAKDYFEYYIYIENEYKLLMNQALFL